MPTLVNGDLLGDNIALSEYWAVVLRRKYRLQSVVKFELFEHSAKPECSQH